MKRFFVFTFCILFAIVTNGQIEYTDKKFSFSIGYGLTGNFFVRSYDEGPSPTGAFYLYEKNFIGTNLSFNAGFKTGKKSELRLGYTRQENYSKRLIYDDGVDVFINAKIRHVNNFFELLYSRNIACKKNIFKPGIGIIYLRPQQEEVEYGPGSILWEERNQKYNRLNDAGVMAEMAYEYKFQPRVNIGIRSQFYFNVTAGIAESVTLYPYIKILF